MLNIGFVGAGRAGRLLALALHRAGWPVTGIFSRTQESAGRLAVAVGAGTVDEIVGLPALCDLIVIAVPDDAIVSVSSALAQFGKLAGRIIVHTSGAHDSGALVAVAQAGARTGSLHPAFAISDEAYALAHVHEATFAVESDDASVRDVLFGLVQALGASSVEIPPGMKAQYHAATVIASNYLVTLYAASAGLLAEIGIGREAAAGLLEPLMRAALGNIAVQGVPGALTGPIARGDAGTVARHIAVLADRADTILEMYQVMGRATLPLAQARGLDAALIDALRATLKG